MNALAISQDDTWIASAADDGRVILWNTVTSSATPRLRDWREARTLAVAPDGSWIAAPGRQRRQVDIIATATGVPIRTLDCPKELRGLAVSPDGRTLASIHDYTKELIIWDTTTWARATVPIDCPASSVRFASDSHHLLIGTRDATILRIETQTWQRNAVYKVEHDRRGPFESLTIDPWRQWVAATNYSGLSIWDFETRTLIATAAPHFTAGHARPHELRACAGDPRGQWLAVAAGPDIRIFTRGAWSDEQRLTCHYGGHVVALAVSPNGQHLASLSTNCTIQITDTTTWQPEASMEINSDPLVCEWVPGDGRFGLAIGGGAGAYLFDYLLPAANSHPSSAGLVTPQTKPARPDAETEISEDSP